MSAPLNIAIAGAGGRMGQMLIDAVAAAPDCVLSGALDIAGSAALGSDRCAHGIRIVAEVAARPGVDDDPGGHAQKKTDLRCMSRA